MKDSKVEELIEKIKEIVDGPDSAEDKLRQMAGLDMSSYLSFIERSTDRHIFASSLVAGDIADDEVYKFAGKLRIKDEPRTVYVMELSQAMPGTTDLESLAAVFADKKSDFFFKTDDRHLVVIKTVDEDDMMDFALSAIDTIESELMVAARVGFSDVKELLTDLKAGLCEAMLTLKVMNLFSEKTNVAAYSKLGIARLIYELPMSLCESFLKEVFGDKIPMDEMDEAELTTINAFYENNLNISETARQLFLHRNTLVYRLERIEKLIGMDIRRFDDAMTFKIAMMVLAHYRQENEA